MEEDNDIQKEMIEKLKGKQILRMEFRFNNMEKYKDICGKIGIKKTKEYFEDLYDLETAKKICNYYWDIVANSVSNVSLGVSNMKIIFEHLAYKEELSKSKVLSIMGAFCINELFGNRFLKTYSRKKHSDIKMLSERINLTTTYTAGVIKRIKGELEQFKPIRFEEWENAEKAIQEARKPIDLNKINIFN
jgi:hypothetical protein